MMIGHIQAMLICDDDLNLKLIIMYILFKIIVIDSDHVKNDIMYQAHESGVNYWNIG